MKHNEKVERNQQLAEMYRSGMGLVEIGRAVGLHHGTVWRILKRMGVEMRPAAPPKGVYPQWLREANERDREYKQWEKDFVL